MELINRNNLDPVTVYTTLKITTMLSREEMAVPARDDGEDDKDYREKLIQVTCMQVLHNLLSCSLFISLCFLAACQGEPSPSR